MAGHSREISRYTSKAIAGEALTQELQWQRTHLPARFREYVYGNAAQHCVR
jgi:transposase